MAQQAVQSRFLDVPKSALVASLVFHLSLLLLIGGIQVLNYFGIHLLPHHSLDKQIYQNFIQVDVVGMPEQAINDKVHMDMSQPVVEKPMTAPTPPQKPVSASDDILKMQEEVKAKEAKAAKELAKKEALEKKKAEEKKLAEAKKAKAQKERLAEKKALEKLEEQARREAALKSLSAKAGRRGRKRIAGNILSSGVALTGNIGTAKDRYTALLVAAIKQHFNVYLWQSKGLVAQVHLEILPSGQVKTRYIAKPSKDPTYDSALLQAIDEAQPLPKPDDPALANEDYNITFIP